MPSLYVDDAAFHAFVPHHQQPMLFAVDDRQMLHLGAELSKLTFVDQSINGTSVDSRSTCSDPGYPDAAEIMHLMALAAQRKSQNTTECVPVPSSEHVAEIVGRQGCKIKALRAKTNTYIKTPVRGEESMFIITGRKEDVEAAKQEILSAADHFTQIRASRRHSQGGIPAPGHITAYVRVPYKFVGLVVGPKGATIKRIQQQTHTYIITPSREKEPIFEVTGLSENVEAARGEIELHIVSRTGNFLDALDAAMANGGVPPTDEDDFRTNGTDLAFDDASGASDAALSVSPTNNVICKPPSMLLTSSQQHSTDSLFPPASRIQKVRYSSSLWSTNGGSTMNSSGSDADDGVWSSGGGDSPNSLSVEPLFPSYLSSIWSDLDDPKDAQILQQKRSASIAVDNAEDDNSWFRNVGNQLSCAWTTSAPHSNARRMSSAPSISGNQSWTTTTLTAPPATLQLCHVCQVAGVDAALVPCGHKCFCFVCATRLRQMPKPVCPICQAPINSSVRLTSPSAAR